MPTLEEQALLAPFQASLPPGTLGPMAQPPRTDGEHQLRTNLRQAQQLLADAGWTVRDGVLRNAAGQALEVECLGSVDGDIKVLRPWMRNLQKLGITLKLRSVDFALYQQRMDKFEYDIVSLNVPGTHNL